MTQVDNNIKLVDQICQNCRNALVCKQLSIFLFKRNTEPYFKLLSLCKGTDSIQFTRTSLGHIISVKDNRISGKIAVFDKCFQAVNNLVNTDSSLIKVHDNTVVDNLIMYFNRMFEVPFFCYFSKNIFIPIDNMINSGSKGHMNYMPLLEQLVNCNMCQARGFTNTLL